MAQTAIDEAAQTLEGSQDARKSGLRHLRAISAQVDGISLPAPSVPPWQAAKAAELSILLTFGVFKQRLQGLMDLGLKAANQSGAPKRLLGTPGWAWMESHLRPVDIDAFVSGTDIDKRPGRMLS